MRQIQITLLLLLVAAGFAALGHKAAAALTADNLLQVPEGSKSTRLALAEFGVPMPTITTVRWSSICA